MRSVSSAVTARVLWSTSHSRPRTTSSTALTAMTTTLLRAAMAAETYFVQVCARVMRATDIVLITVIVNHCPCTAVVSTLAGTC